MNGETHQKNDRSPLPLSLVSSRRSLESRTPRGRLDALSLGEPLEPGMAGKLEEIARLPYVASVLALPDLHWKARMEVPSSLAIATRGMIVPEFTSADVNDGMGVVATGISEDRLTPARIEAFFRTVNADSAAHFFDRNRLSLDASDLERAVLEGARGVLDRYGFEPRVLEAFEQDGTVAPAGGGREALGRAVPAALMASSFSRSEMGLNFGGNHFLELQAVDAILDVEAARRFGFERGQVVVMYHLGPGPFAGTLLHHYVRREKLRRERVPLFFLSKLLFHYLQRGPRGGARKWALHFRKNGWTPFPADSEEGMLLQSAIALATNFGSAYRLATVRAITDGVRQAIAPEAEPRLLCDISHNGVHREDVEGESMWVARHNACRLEPGRLTLVAGSYDVPSYLGIGADDGGRFHSYDHGAGNLIDHYRSHGLLRPVAGSVLRFKGTRGRKGGLTDRYSMSLSSSEPIDRLMECLEQNRVMRSAVRLRPLGNFKN